MSRILFTALSIPKTHGSWVIPHDILFWTKESPNTPPKSNSWVSLAFQKCSKVSRTPTYIHLQLQVWSWYGLHPVYPFLAQFEINSVFLYSSSKEAYLLLWYLVDAYTISVTFYKPTMLVYLAQCAISRVPNNQLMLLKWLLLLEIFLFGKGR